MTESEALKWLKEMQNPMISEAELYCAETYYGLGKMVYPEPEDYVFETAIKALEKQMPKKAKITGHNNAINTDVGYCPICNGAILRACDNSYCPDCGQKLDWSDEE